MLFGKKKVKPISNARLRPRPGGLVLGLLPRLRPRPAGLGLGPESQSCGLGLSHFCYTARPKTDFAHH